MLITVYQRTRAGFNVVRRYYSFNQSRCERIAPSGGPTAKEKFRCPGCSELFSEIQLAGHSCLGGSKEYPRLPPSKADKKSITR